MSSSYRCSCVGCEGEGLWVPALVMTAKENTRVGGKSRVELNKMTFCPEHKKKASIADFLGDEVWDQMARGFLLQGREMPERGSIELDFYHVHYGYFH